MQLSLGVCDFCGRLQLMHTATWKALRMSVNREHCEQSNDNGDRYDETVPINDSPRTTFSGPTVLTNQIDARMERFREGAIARDDTWMAQRALVADGTSHVFVSHSQRHQQNELRS
jgi:hypothetical protein